MGARRNVKTSRCGSEVNSGAGAAVGNESRGWLGTPDNLGLVSGLKGYEPLIPTGYLLAL